jgi:hypothetical protein
MDARAAADPAIRVHWMSLGELSRLIETFQAEGVTRAVMAGQVKHKQIFSSIRPDWRLAKLLLNLRTRNTDMLLGAVAKVLATRASSSSPPPTTSSRCSPNPASSPARAHEDELKDIAYGRTVARAIAGLRPRPDRRHRRAGLRRRRGDGGHRRHHRARRRALPHALDPPTELGIDPQPLLTVVKVAKPNQDMRFDVPVIGVATIEAMARAGATCLAIEAMVRSTIAITALTGRYCRRSPVVSPSQTTNHKPSIWDT